MNRIVVINVLLCSVIIGSVLAEEGASNSQWRLKPLRAGDWDYKDVGVSILESYPKRPLRGLYLGIVDDGYSPQPGTNAGDLGLFWIAEAMVAEAFEAVNRSVTLTGVGTYIRRGMAIDNARFDFLVVGGGSLIPKSIPWRALLFSNGRDSRSPPPVFWFGTGFDEEFELFPEETIRALRTRLGVPPSISHLTAEDEIFLEFDIAIDDFDNEPEPFSLRSLEVPSRYERGLRIAATLPNSHGGVRGNYSATLLQKYYDGSSIARAIGDAGVLADHYLSTSHRYGLPRVRGPLYVVNYGQQSLTRGQSQMTRTAFKAAATDLARKGMVVFVPFAFGDIEPSLMMLREVYQVLMEEEVPDAAKRLQCLGGCKLLPDLGQILSIMKVADATLAFRLHGAVTSLAAGTPFVALAYRMKVYDFADTLQLSDHVVPPEDLVTDQSLLSKKMFQVAQKKHLFRSGAHKAIQQISLIYQLKLRHFAAVVVNESMYQQQWRNTEADRWLGYPEGLQAWPEAPERPWVVMISVVARVNLPSDDGVRQRLVESIRLVNKQLAVPELVQFVLLVGDVTEQLLALLEQEFTPEQMESLKFIFTESSSYWHETLLWFEEYQHYFAGARFFYRDVVYESHQQSSLWGILAQARAEKHEQGEETVLDPFLAAPASLFRQHITESSLRRFPQVSKAFLEDLQKRVLLHQQQQQQSANENTSPDGDSTLHV